MWQALYVAIWLSALIGIAVPLGRYMARVFTGERVFLTRGLRPLERLVYRLCGVDEAREMTAREYGSSVAVFTLAGLVLLFLLQALQRLLPLNPAGMAGVRWHTAINTAISFVTNAFTVTIGFTVSTINSLVVVSTLMFPAVSVTVTLTS